MLTLKNIQQTYAFAFSFLWNVLAKPTETLQYASLRDRFDGRSVVHCFVLPMAVMTAVFGFIGSLFEHGMIGLEKAVVKTIFIFISSVMNFYIQFFLLRLLSERFFVSGVPNRNFSVATASLLTVVFAVDMITGLVPDMFFFKFFYLYVIYIAWQLSESVVPVEESRRNKFMVVVTVFIILISYALPKLLRIMIPNISY